MIRRTPTVIGQDRPRFIGRSRGRRSKISHNPRGSLETRRSGLTTSNNGLEEAWNEATTQDGRGATNGRQERYGFALTGRLVREAGGASHLTRHDMDARFGVSAEHFRWGQDHIFAVCKVMRE